MYIIKRIVLVLIIMIVTTFIVGCGKTSIIGTWRSNNYAYTFNTDKTGEYISPEGIIEFTYNDEDDELLIYFDGSIDSVAFQYRIKGKKLIMMNDSGERIKYTIKK